MEETSERANARLRFCALANQCVGKRAVLTLIDGSTLQVDAVIAIRPDLTEFAVRGLWTPLGTAEAVVVRGSDMSSVRVETAR